MQLRQREAKRILFRRHRAQRRHRAGQAGRAAGEIRGKQRAVVGQGLRHAGWPPEAATRICNRRAGECRSKTALLFPPPWHRGRRRGLRRRRAAECGGRGLRQRAADRMKHELVDRAAIAETHFDLRRMDIDVYLRRIDFQRQHVGWEALAVQHVLIRRAHRMGEQLVAHEAAVHIKILGIATRLRSCRQTSESMQAHGARGFIQMQARRCELGAENLGAALGDLGDAPVIGGAAVVCQRKRHVRARQRDAPHDLGAVAEFGLLGLQELAPRRRIEVQVPHIDRSAECAGGGSRCVCGAAIELPCMRRIDGAGGQRQLRHGCDRGQRLAAKTECRDMLQVGQRCDLRGGVPRQRQRHLLGRDAASVVGDGDALDAALFEADENGRCAGIECVFEEFLDHCRRAFDDFASGDLRNQLVGQRLDRTRGLQGSIHARIIPPDCQTKPCMTTPQKRLESRLRMRTPGV